MNNNFYKIRESKNEFLNFIKSSDGSLYQKVIRGGFWTFFLRAISQLLYLIKIIVLARLLSPSDFGLFGIALLSLSALETFSQTGFDRALIQKRGDIKSYLNSAWTIEIIRGIIIAMILFFISSYVATFFNAPKVISILRIIGLAVIIKSLTNIAIVYFQKELEFKKFFKYQFLGAFFDAFVTIGIAVVFQSVWALVIGLLAGNLVKLIMSYKIDPYRPKLEFDLLKLKELWGFGKWVLGSSMLVFLVTHGDDIFVGKLLGITALGFYQMAYLISNAPATEISNIISQVAFPAYSKLQNNISRFRDACLKTLQFMLLLSFPIASIIFVLGYDFVIIFLGKKWIPIAPIMQVLIIAGLMRSIAIIFGYAFYALRKPKIDTKIQTIRFFILSISIYPFAVNWGMLGIAYSVLLSIFVSSVISVINIVIITECGVKKISKAIILPTINGIIMILFLFFLKYNINTTEISGFILVTILGISAYIITVYFLNRYYYYDIRSAIKDITDVKLKSK